MGYRSLNPPYFDESISAPLIVRFWIASFETREQLGRRAVWEDVTYYDVQIDHRTFKMCSCTSGLDEPILESSTRSCAGQLRWPRTRTSTRLQGIDPSEETPNINLEQRSSVRWSLEPRGRTCVRTSTDTQQMNFFERTNIFRVDCEVNMLDIGAWKANQWIK